MSIASKLCCPHILDLTPYQSARRIGGTGDVWLNANELPFPGIDALTHGYNRYPEFQSHRLLDAYAKYTGVSPTQLLCVRGADEGIELLIRCFCTPAVDSVVITTPTYGMYQVSAGIHNVGVIQVPRSRQFDLDLPLIKKQSAKIMFICSPNNPTGNVSSREELRELLRHFNDSALIVLDEAYVEFSEGGTSADLIAEHPNLVVLRTMSKAFGMAALRCGFVVANEDIIELLRRIIAPYPVPSPVEEIAIQALSRTGIARMHQQVAEIIGLREQFIKEILQLRIVTRVSESQANFVLVEFADEPATLKALNREGIVVRTPYSQGLIENSQRISIGTAQEMARVTKVLRSISERR